MLGAIFGKVDRQKALMTRSKAVAGHPRLRLDSLKPDGFSEGEDNGLGGIHENLREEEAIEHRIF